MGKMFASAKFSNNQEKYSENTVYQKERDDIFVVDNMTVKHLNGPGILQTTNQKVTIISPT